MRLALRLISEPSSNTNDLVLGNISEQAWTADGNFIYSSRTTDGKKYILANPSSGTKKEVLNQQKLVQSIGELTGRKLDVKQLPIKITDFSEDGQFLRFNMGGNRYETNLKTYRTNKLSSRQRSKEILSPNGKKAAYIKNYNLWVRNIETGERTQLTTGGQANQLLVESLKGDLLLSHGMMDANVPPTITMLVAEALIRADKDFDMFMIPNAGHGYGYAGDYFMNRRWDYFVKHLKGAVPPLEFQFDENP